MCHKPQCENGKALHVHHHDWDKHSENVVALCSSCHGTLHATADSPYDRYEWEVFFRYLIALGYNNKCSYTRDEFDQIEYRHEPLKRLPNEKTKICKHCGKEFTKKPKETWAYFNKKLYCCMEHFHADEEFRVKHRELTQSDEFRKKTSEGMKTMLASDEKREKWSAASKKKWQDPEFREHRRQGVEAMDRDARNAKASESMKKKWLEPGYRDSVIPAMKRGNAKPECKERKSHVSKEMWNTPWHRETRSRQAKELWSNEGYREKTTSAMRGVTKKSKGKA